MGQCRLGKSLMEPNVTGHRCARKWAPPRPAVVRADLNVRPARASLFHLSRCFNASPRGFRYTIKLTQIPSALNASIPLTIVELQIMAGVVLEYIRVGDSRRGSLRRNVFDSWFFHHARTLQIRLSRRALCGPQRLARVCDPSRHTPEPCQWHVPELLGARRTRPGCAGRDSIHCRLYALQSPVRTRSVTDTFNPL